MVKRKTGIKIRKAHRYLAIFLGIRFLIRTIGGNKKNALTNAEAVSVAKRFMKKDRVLQTVMRLDSVGTHSEYRVRPLGAYEIVYRSHENIKAYEAISNVAFSYDATPKLAMV